MDTRRGVSGLCTCALFDVPKTSELDGSWFSPAHSGGLTRPIFAPVRSELKDCYTKEAA